MLSSAQNVPEHALRVEMVSPQDVSLGGNISTELMQNEVMRLRPELQRDELVQAGRIAEPHKVSAAAPLPTPGPGVVRNTTFFQAVDLQENTALLGHSFSSHLFNPPPSHR